MVAHPKLAVILAGGYGTRLGVHRSIHAKPMVKIAGKPFLEYLFKVAQSLDCKNVLVLAGFRAKAIKARYHKKQFNNMRIQVAVEKSPQGTGGALNILTQSRFLREFKQPITNPIWVLNGDSIYLGKWPNNLTAQSQLSLLEHPKPIAAKISVCNISNTLRYGSVIMDQNKRITSFKEKSLQPENAIINTGVYLVRPSKIIQILHRLNNNIISMEEDVFPELIKQSALYGQQSRHYKKHAFVDIGIVNSLAYARKKIPAWLRHI